MKLSRTVELDVDSSLYELYPKLCDPLISSKNDNTVKSYFNACKRWERFITLHGQNALPTQPVHVALYLTSLLKTVLPIMQCIMQFMELNGPMR